MGSRRKVVQHTILIVCEGESTGPLYFKDLLEEAKSGYPEGLSYDIQPQPRYEGGAASPAVNPHKTARKKRNLIPPERELEDAVEDEYKSMPTRFVRAAQKGLEGMAYDQAFAIFDQDGHPEIQQAFALAEEEVDGKKVVTGFSSVSFEHWILLHFGFSDRAFNKSDCKDEHGRYLKCGTHAHGEDCKGVTCVAGHLRENGHLPYEKNHKKLWNDLQPKLWFACRNAAWLRMRQLQNSGQQIHQLNPVTTIDIVIQSIFKNFKEVICVRYDEPQLWKEIEYTVQPGSFSGIKLLIRNTRPVAFLLKTDDYWIEDEAGVKRHAETTLKVVLEPGKCLESEYAISEGSAFLALVGPAFELLCEVRESK